MSAGAELRLANNVTAGARLDVELAGSATSLGGQGSVRYVW